VSSFNTILVGFDDGEPARRALARAADLAEGLHARLVVLAVASPPLPSVGFDAALPGADPEQLAVAGTYELDHAERSLEDARGLLAGRALEADYVSELGAPAERIVAIAEERGADLIVVGTRHAGFFARLVEGSVSDAVSHESRRDVLIVQ
jgi:nucleotide-binding universal stress UspA family protein